MLQQIKRLLIAFAFVCITSRAAAFALMGPYPEWQTPELGYNPFGNELGGPMTTSSEYRINVPTLYYAYDESFLNFFGAQGTNEIGKAFAAFNDLPPVSQLSSNLLEYPTDTRRMNFKASALGLMDLKSFTMAAIMEQLGLTSPERYVWTLRRKNEAPLFYMVIKRNYDPVSYSPSSFVNGTLYTYVIRDPVYPDPQYADAVEVQVDPLQFGSAAVASGLTDFVGGGSLRLGEFYTGLTRDDVGGLRFLYRTNNYQIENLIAGVTAPSTTTNATNSSSSPWGIPGGTNAVSTNNVVTTNSVTTNSIVGTAIRPGVNRLKFEMGKYDSLIGSTFIVITNIYTDYFVSNSLLYTQAVQRVISSPDILFIADDLGFTTEGLPVRFERTDSGAWENNDALNGQAVEYGPGVINLSTIFRYSNLAPYYINYPSEFMDELGAIQGASWASFDGSTNEPFVFPDGYSVQWLDAQILNGIGTTVGTTTNISPWIIPNSQNLITNK